MNAIPAIAAYESWNPIDRAAEGVRHSCIINAASNTFPVLLYRPVSRAASFNMMKMKALVMEGPAPVANVYMPHSRMVRKDLAQTAVRLKPANESKRLIIRYITPR